jgi:hypothetical protein
MHSSRPPWERGDSGALRLHNHLEVTDIYGQLQRFGMPPSRRRRSGQVPEVGRPMVGG